MTAPNFKLITELQTLNRRDFYLADESLAKPLNSNPLVDGEWLELDLNYKLIRGASAEGIVPVVFPVHTEKGRYDVQAIGKVNVIFSGMYEAETSLVDMTGINAVGQRLTVKNLSLGGVNKRGLGLEGSTSGRAVVGYVTRIVGSKVRFIHTGVVKV